MMVVVGIEEGGIGIFLVLVDVRGGDSGCSWAYWVSLSVLVLDAFAGLVFGLVV